MKDPTPFDMMRRNKFVANTALRNDKKQPKVEITSDEIARHIAAFKAAGGNVNE